MKAKEIYMYVLGTMIVICIIAFSTALIFFEIPKENVQMVNIVLGTIIGSFTTVVGYFFGSSKGSADKTDMMKKDNTI